MSWMVTGGAGYIGAHVVRSLLASGHEVVVVDDLSTGVSSKIPESVPLVNCSVLDADAIGAAIDDFTVTGVVHLAAKKAVGESVARPYWYFRENVDGLLTLLEQCEARGVRKFVYSSSASVYGAPTHTPVKEDAPLLPISPYGQTKVAGEWLLADAAVAYGLDYVSLRYFNVVGAGATDLGDPGVFNLVPLALRALSAGQAPKIFGDDYATPDGTCIRDYVDVADLADAHASAASAMAGAGDGVARMFNVGRGEGFSVRQVLDEVSRVSGIGIEPIVVQRRPGDPDATVADVSAIETELGWRATRGLTEIVEGAWAAWPKP